MIELSYIDLALIAWAALATAAWLTARDDSRMAKKMLRAMIEDKDAREQILKAHEEFMRREGQA